MSTKNKKKKQKPIKPKIDLLAGQPRPQPVAFASAAQMLENARAYPFFGCWVMQEWHDQGITPVVIARQQAPDRIAYATFLVDTYLLGVKDAHWKLDISLKHFTNTLDELLHQSTLKIEIGFAHELIYGAVEYARRYGFEPHPDYNKACLLLDPPDQHPRNHGIEFGKDGKPTYISGPYDNPERILNTLKRTAGEGNYHYMLGLGPGM